MQVPSFIFDQDDYFVAKQAFSTAIVVSGVTIGTIIAVAGVIFASLGLVLAGAAFSSCAVLIGIISFIGCPSDKEPETTEPVLNPEETPIENEGTLNIQPEDENRKFRKEVADKFLQNYIKNVTPKKNELDSTNAENILTETPQEDDNRDLREEVAEKFLKNYDERLNLEQPKEKEASFGEILTGMFNENHANIHVINSADI